MKSICKFNLILLASSIIFFSSCSYKDDYEAYETDVQIQATGGSTTTPPTQNQDPEPCADPDSENCTD